MPQPTFLDVSDVLRIHVDMVDRYGGHASLRDQGLLESALAVPRATFGGTYLHQGIVEMAAAYLFHIVRNHPFIDGNKRTGAAAALVFLFLNDMEIDATEDELVEITLAIADGSANKQRATEWLHDHAF